MKTANYLSIALVMVLTLSVHGQVTYQIDDGVSENNLGQGFNGDFFWGNYFNEDEGGSTITSLSVAIGDVGVPVGYEFQVAIYEDLDNDGDPTTNLQFLVSVNATVEFPSLVGMDMFQDIQVPDTEISGGFFVGVLFDGTNNPLPANFDQTTSLQQCWFAEHNLIEALDIMDPFGSSTLSGMVDSFGFPGNFLLRAHSEACILGDVNMDGKADLLDVAPFVDILAKSGFQCEADVNEDGKVDLTDIAPFVDIITGN